MVFAPVAALVFSLLAAPVSGAYGLVARWRAKRRNTAGACAACGTAWTDIGVAATRFRVEGHEICASCASRMRRRLLTELLALGVLTLGAVGLFAGGVIGALSNAYHYPVWMWLLAATPPVALGSASWMVVRRMRAANRQSIEGPVARPALRTGGA